MIKTLRNLLKQDKERFVVPRGVQDVIPIKAIYDDGIFQVGRDKFSKTYKFSDINYAVASREDKEAMFLEYSELLNSLDSGATTKITINNRRLNRANFEKTILLPLKGDALDEYREEYNRMLLDKATGANAIIQEKYITISVCKKNVEEARNYFARVGADLIAHFGRLGSKCVELEPDERLRIFHDFYRAGEETEFRFDIKETRRKGHDFKDFICPDSMEFTGDYFKIGERYGRVLFLREYASYIKDSMVAEMTDLNRNLMMSIDVIPVPTDEAVREAESRLLGVETNATNWQRRQNANNNFSAQLPYDIEQQRKEMKEFLDDLTTRDQRMMFAVLTMVHTADTKEQLDNDTEALLTTARKHLCQFGILKFQQLDGLNTAMPFGVRKIESFRTLTTESLAVFIPFRVQDICHTNGVYYGQNVITQNRAKGKKTFIFIDEIYLLFQHEYSANFLFTLWKRVRKYGAYATGITQNVDDLLQSHTARTMLANSEFIVMLNQASTDRLELAKLLNISDTQLSYITNADAGHGLIKVGFSLVPFANKFPKNTKLYKLMTTKPGEGA